MISVIIPIYNAEKYLPEMLTCLSAQTERDLEIILINDGSTDATADICTSAAHKDSRIRYVYQENAGVSSARNHALSMAVGEYIAFLDADDSIDSDYLERLLHACINAEIAVCDVVVETREGKRITKFSAGDRTMTGVDAMNLLLERKKINSGPCGKLFRREVVEDLCFPELKTYEDILFVRDAFSRVHKVTSVSETAYHYYDNAGSAMHQLQRAPSFDVITATSDLLQYIVSHVELEPECLYVTVSHLYQYVLGADKTSPEGREFAKKVRSLYRKYCRSILKSRAFPWKEKVLYILFSYGFFEK